MQVVFVLLKLSQRFNITDAKTEPALVEKEAPKKVEVKTPTKEDVAELGATAKQTQEMQIRQKKSWIKRMKLLIKQKRKSLT